MAFKVDPVFANLPNAYVQKIQTKLKDPTLHQGTEKKYYEVLSYGLSFQYENKIWNIQIGSDLNKTFVRMSTEDTIHVWLYDAKDTHKLRHCDMIATPTETREELLPSSYGCHLTSCSHSAFFVTVILSGNCLGSASAPRLPQTVHDFASKWIEKYSSTKKYLIPLSKPLPLDASQYDPLIKQVDDQFFIRVFKLLGIITIAYLIYEVFNYLFYFKPSRSLSSIQEATVINKHFPS